MYSLYINPDKIVIISQVQYRNTFKPFRYYTDYLIYIITKNSDKRIKKMLKNLLMCDILILQNVFCR